jgi:D-tyrosyl-tRNA(Tyr) deacylase
MKIVVQRVLKASVVVNKKQVGAIGKGLFVLLGVDQNDGDKDAFFLAEKLSKLRIMSDENDKMNLSITDTTKQVLVVSQFTLIADTQKGNRPSFVKAAQPQLAKKLYNLFISKLEDQGLQVQTGKFGAYMDISARLDGPVTIIIDSNKSN